MQSNKSPLFRRFRSGIYLQVLLMFWTFGIILGTTTGAVSSAAALSMMHRGIASSVSIVSLVVATVLPFVISAAVLLLHKQWLLYPFVFLKGVAFAHSGMVCLRCFRSAGWLARLVIFFPQLMTVSALWLVWLWACSQRDRVSRCGIFWLSIYLLVIGLLDYFLVVPYAGRLG